MDYLENHLPKGERVVARTRKSLYIFIREVLIAVVLVGIILGLQFGANIDQKIMIWVYVAAAVIVLIFFMQSLVKYASTLMVVTTHKFMYKEDIITIKVFDTQLSNIDGIEVEYKTPFRRAINVGNIKISTRNSVHTFRNIARPDKFTTVLNKQTSDVADRRINRVHVTFGIAKPKGQNYHAEGEKVAGEAKPAVSD